MQVSDEQIISALLVCGMDTKKAAALLESSSTLSKVSMHASAVMAAPRMPKAVFIRDLETWTNALDSENIAGRDMYIEKMIIPKLQELDDEYLNRISTTNAWVKFADKVDAIANPDLPETVSKSKAIRRLNELVETKFIIRVLPYRKSADPERAYYRAGKSPSIDVANQNDDEEEDDDEEELEDEDTWDPEEFSSDDEQPVFSDDDDDDDEEKKGPVEEKYEVFVEERRRLVRRCLNGGLKKRQEPGDPDDLAVNSFKYTRQQSGTWLELVLEEDDPNAWKGDAVLLSKYDMTAELAKTILLRAGEFGKTVFANPKYFLNINTKEDPRFEFLDLVYYLVINDVAAATKRLLSVIIKTGRSNLFKIAVESAFREWKKSTDVYNARASPPFELKPTDSIYPYFRCAQAISTQILNNPQDEGNIDLFLEAFEHQQKFFKQVWFEVFNNTVTKKMIRYDPDILESMGSDPEYHQEHVDIIPTPANLEDLKNRMIKRLENQLSSSEVFSSEDEDDADMIQGITFALWMPAWRLLRQTFLWVQKSRNELALKLSSSSSSSSSATAVVDPELKEFLEVGVSPDPETLGIVDLLKIRRLQDIFITEQRSRLRFNRFQNTALEWSAPDALSKYFDNDPFYGKDWDYKTWYAIRSDMSPSMKNLLYGVDNSVLFKKYAPAEMREYGDGSRRRVRPRELLNEYVTEDMITRAVKFEWEKQRRLGGQYVSPIWELDSDANSGSTTALLINHLTKANKRFTLTKKPEKYPEIAWTEIQFDDDQSLGADDDEDDDDDVEDLFGDDDDVYDDDGDGDGDGAGLEEDYDDIIDDDIIDDDDDDDGKQEADFAQR